MNNKQSGSLRFNRRKIVPVLVLVTLSGYILYRLIARRHSPDLDYPEDASREAQIRYLMQEHITHTGCQPVHSFVLHVENSPERILIREGISVRGRSDTRIDADYQYNVASITKPIVATIILQLMEEGKLRLNDPARKYLSALEYLRFEDLHILEGRTFADEIRIDHLLQHRTGLGDIFLDAATRFNLSVLLHPRRSYSPQRVMETFFAYKLNRSPHFRPGKGYYYSDINYVLLGLIVEQITNDSLPHQIRQRVLTPLAMHDTYFEFYEAERGHGKRLDCYLVLFHVTSLDFLMPIRVKYGDYDYQNSLDNCRRVGHARQVATQC